MPPPASGVEPPVIVTSVKVAFPRTSATRSMPLPSMVTKNPDAETIDTSPRISRSPPVLSSSMPGSVSS